MRKATPSHIPFVRSHPPERRRKPEIGHVDVEARGPDVILSGEVPSSKARMIAEYDAWTIRGVGRVHNRLEVSRPDQDPLPSAEDLRNRTLRALSEIGDDAGTDVDVSAESGKITLTGYCATPEQMRSIHRTALQVPGVLEVINKVSVTPSGLESDRRLGRDIKEKLYENVMIDVNTVDVTVDNGSVYLSGYVEKEEDVDEARAIADMPGIHEITYELYVTEEKMLFYGNFQQ